MSQWALVTGATVGIGESFTRLLASKGYNIVLVARDEVRLHERASSLREKYGVQTFVLPADLASKKGVKSVEEYIDTYEIEVLINNAGFGINKAFTASDLDANGAMNVLLKDALMPNLVQTLENNPAFVHGGPFANIAHGCNTVLATKTALKLADYVVTEAGFGADLGAEKFFDIKCRKAKLNPSAAVIVATIKAIKMHGGVAKEDLNKENLKAVEAGLANLGRHIKNIEKFGVPAVVAVNNFTSDTKAEFQIVKNYCEGLGVEAILCTHWEKGSSGTSNLAKKVVELAESNNQRFKPIYEDSLSLWEKVNVIAKSIYGASEGVADKLIRDQFKNYEAAGYGNFPICMAKTQYSFSTDPNLKGAPSGHVVPIREIRLSAGAEFFVVVLGSIMTMPGLPQAPAANSIRLQGSVIEGLF